MAGAFEGRTKDGSHVIVAIEDLRVILFQEGEWWIAQGVDLDYIAYGRTLEDAKGSFERGLLGTIKANLDKFKTTKHFLAEKPPKEVLEAFYSAVEKGGEALLFSGVTVQPTPLIGEVSYYQIAAPPLPQAA